MNHIAKTPLCIFWYSEETSVLSNSGNSCNLLALENVIQMHKTY